MGLLTIRRHALNSASLGGAGRGPRLALRFFGDPIEMLFGGGSPASGSLQRGMAGIDRNIGLKLDVKITGLDETSAEFRQARREFNARLRTANQRAGQRVLPEIERDMGAYGEFAKLYVRRERSGVALGSRQRGSLNRAVGWLDFGGRRPMDTTRRTGPYAIAKALDRHRSSIEEAQLEEIMKAFDGLEHHP